MRVKLRDMKTRDEVWVEKAPRAFEWIENNWSCDCNREKHFGHDSAGDTCLGTKRYLVVEIEGDPDGHTPNSFNEDYPTEWDSEGNGL